MKQLKSPDIISIVLIAVQVIVTGVTTLILALFKNYYAWVIALVDIGAIIGMAIVQTSYYIAFFLRKHFGVFFIADRDAIDKFYPDDDPSVLLVSYVKIFGYLLMSVQFVLLFL